jgi:hypothetical protein
MGNRYIHPDDEFDININLKVKVTSVGNWSGIPQEVTEENYEMVKNNGNLEMWIKKHLENQIMYQNDLNTDLLDVVVFELVEVL